MGGTKVVWAAAVVLLVMVGGCAGGYNSGEMLRRQVDRFNDDVRWGRYFSAAEYVHDEARGEWLSSRRTWSDDDLRIADYEVVDSTEADDGSTTIRVVVSWYRLSVSEVQTTMFAQSWRRFGRTWMMTSEEIEEGTPPVAEETAL